MGHGRGVGAAAGFFSGGVALDHDGDGDLGVFHGRKADEPGEIQRALGGALLGGASLAGDAQAGNVHEGQRKEFGRAAALRDPLHAFEQGGIAFYRESDGLGVEARALRIVDQGGRSMDLIAGDRGDERRHLERRDAKKTLADGEIGRVAGKPALLLGAQFPGGVGDDHRPGLVGELDAGRPVEMEAAALGGNEFGSDIEAVFVEEDVAALFHGGAVVDQAVGMAVVTGEAPAADEVIAGAVHLRIGQNGAAAQAGDGGEDLEGRTRGVGALDGAGVPRTLLVDLGGLGGAEARGEVVEVVVGFAGEHQHLARRDIQRHGGARHLGISYFFLRGQLQVDVEAGGEIFALHRQAALERRVDFVA